MFSWFDVVPVEVQERILSNLPNGALVSASKVCRLWFTLSARIAKTRCQTIIPSECLHEVEQEINDEKDDVWLAALARHDRQHLILDDFFHFDEPQHSIEFDGYNELLCCDLHGSLIYAARSNCLEIYDICVGDDPVGTFNCGQGRVRQIRVVSKLNALVLLSNAFEVYALPDLADNDVCDMTRLEIAFEDQPNDLDVTDLRMKTFKVDGTLIAVQSSSYHISVFRLDRRDDVRVTFTWLKTFETTSKIYRMSMWNDEVLALLVTGEVLHWEISSGDYSHCGVYQELRYDGSGMWIFRGRIFCSTVIYRGLLGYWHMETGTSYWLIGKPTRGLARCRTLDAAINNEFQEVYSICLKQRLLFCGTRIGDILIYYLSDSFFDEHGHCSNDTLDAEFGRDPDVIITLDTLPIEGINVEFTDSKIYIVACLRPNRSKYRYLQCLVITDGHWLAYESNNREIV